MTQQELNKRLVEELEQLRSENKRLKKDFEIEKNIKNGLYFFILKNGRFEDLGQFEPNVNYQDTDFHAKALNYWVFKLPENQN